MKRYTFTFALIAFIPMTIYAQPIDIIGGADSSTQTIHHCGFLPSSGKLYTSSPVTVGIIERKLQALGYSRVSTDGRYGKNDRAAVRRFQADHGLQVDGIVGPQTAQRLAYVSHPSAHVRGCYRMSGGTR